MLADLAALRDAALSPYAREELSPIGGGRPLILSAMLLEELAVAPDRDMIVTGLSALPCPVIGMAADGATVRDACDVFVSSDHELETTVANIGQAPLAAMTLVQLLRFTLALPIPQALVAESMAYATLQAGPEFRAWLAGRADVAPAIATNEPPVLLRREDARLDIRLNRPERRNAISVELRDALCEALQAAVADTTIRHVTLAGEGKCFSIGGDLDEFGLAPDPATAHAVRSIRLPAFFAAQCADRLEARLHGACIGAGIEIPAFADRVVAARDSFFQLPELRFGLIPGAGGTVSLPRRIGRHRAAWLVLTGRRISARTALEWGLVDAVSD
jgi:hypothetical protein